MSTTDVPTEERAAARGGGEIGLDFRTGCGLCTQECRCGAITVEPETI